MAKTLFITGASSGIGAHTARAAVSAGWNVGLFARSADKLKDLAEEFGDRALALPGDATSYEDQCAALAQLDDKYGSVDAAFANAGRGSSEPGVEGGDPEDWDGMVDLNIKGALYTAHAALPHLRTAKGQFLVTGSMAGRNHLKGSIYGATKWFIHGFAGNLAQEMAEWGGRCMVVAPGMVDTEFFDSAKPDKLKPEDIAAAMIYALDAPQHVNVREVYLVPTN
ncbi:SDR family oxidoreductase [Sulfitobacter sp. S190]|uniref:SDR family oxidoreductase n=1 Tax=Sulfitobacter sp. S190 TaxID=2867022 RepID=UPI0021A6D3E3|nr:SDR family oxidoreductase [Sulfitobacter sp. S190]UWR23542.1 SDR family oxidoreductase [Sulfitobacter sp. S190]